MQLQDQVHHIKEYKQFAQKTLSLYKKEYYLGKRSLLDLLSVQNDLVGAKSQLINVEYNLLFSKYRILNAMGIMAQHIVGTKHLLFSKVGLPDVPSFKKQRSDEGL